MPIGPPDKADDNIIGGLEQFPGVIFLRIFAVLAGGISYLRATVEPAIRSVLALANTRHQNQVLTPAESAIAVVKGVANDSNASTEAALSGIGRERFDALVGITGNPPGPQELLDQWRRKLIDTETLEHGLRQGYLKNEWIPFMEAFRYVPLTPHAYLQGAVEGHISLPDAIAKADGLGLTESDAQLVYETLGNPPGVVEMLKLWKRGVVTEEQVNQAIRESHYKNKYVDIIKEYATYFPPPRTITTLLSHGAITQDQANKLFEEAGLTPELARAYTASALHVATASHKELTVGQVSSLYSDHLITREAALADLARVGYGGDAAALLLDLADAKAKQAVRAEAINGVRHVYLARRVDDAGAMADLAKFGVGPEQQASLLELWKLQRLTPSKSLTIGQLNQAVKKGAITGEVFLARAVDLGYTPADAQILLDIDVPPNTP